MGFEYAVLLLDFVLPIFGQYATNEAMILIYLANSAGIGMGIYKLLSPVYAQ